MSSVGPGEGRWPLPATVSCPRPNPLGYRPWGVRVPAQGRSAWRGTGVAAVWPALLLSLQRGMGRELRVSVPACAGRCMWYTWAQRKGHMVDSHFRSGPDPAGPSCDLPKCPPSLAHGLPAAPHPPWHVAMLPPGQGRFCLGAFALAVWTQFPVALHPCCLPAGPPHLP